MTARPLGGQPVLGQRRGLPVHRPLTRSHQAWQPASSLAKLAYSSARFTSVGTRSALAIFTVASVPALGLRVERPARLHRTAIPATCATVTVPGLSLSR